MASITDSINSFNASKLSSDVGALSNLILVTPNSNIGYQSQSGFSTDSDRAQSGEPTIVFNYEGEQTVTLESDITDHFTEENSPVQDHIAIRPEIVTTHGFIGELNDVIPDILKPLKEVADRLSNLGAYEPALSTTALIAFNNAKFLYDTGKKAFNSAKASLASVGNVLGINLGEVQTKQQECFIRFYQYWQTKTLFTVQTPWNILNNCAIQSLRAMQDADSRVITDFEVTFKKIRIANTAVVSNGLLLSGLSGRSFQGNASLLNTGDETLTSKFRLTNVNLIGGSRV